jgi:hypothetical protein
MKRLLIAAASVGLLLGACVATPSPAPPTEIVTQDVDKPVAASCVPPNVGPAPTGYADDPTAMRAAKSGAARYDLSVQGSSDKTDRLNTIEPVLEACRKAGAK